MAELEVEVPKTIEDGKHKGEITRIDYRHDPYEYTDVYIKAKAESGEEVEIKHGCPTKVTTGTKLGKLLMAFGAELKAGTKIDPEKFLKGKVEFMTITEETDRGTFARVVDGSLKPSK